MQQEMNLHSTHMYFYTSLITLKFMKTTVARQLWTRTLAVQFLYPVQNCCVWMLSASKCPNVSLLWLQAVELTLQKLEPCRSSLGSEDKLSRELWCFSLFILPFCQLVQWVTWLSHASVRICLLSYYKSKQQDQLTVDENLQNIDAFENRI